jgi:L-ascorbate metabolism protein UlaG (beta-lactamase superfamily)
MPADAGTRIPKVTEESVIAVYTTLWDELISEWLLPQQHDRAWLIYSANYLFHTAGVRWVMDPVTLHHRLPSAPEVDISTLCNLDYIVLTHEHKDHLDLDLLFRLKDYPARWVVPLHLRGQLQSLEVPDGKMIITEPGKTLDLGSLALTAFNGLHWEYSSNYPDGRHGVPATGYLLEFNQRRWLIPGDTRTYESARLPAFGKVDGLIAHLWLGRGQALHDDPSMLEAFCQFHQALQAGRIVITHLNEWGRPSTDRWDERHALAALNWFKDQVPGLPVSYAGIGECIDL